MSTLTKGLQIAQASILLAEKQLAETKLKAVTDQNNYKLKDYLPLLEEIIKQKKQIYSLLEANVKLQQAHKELLASLNAAKAARAERLN